MVVSIGKSVERRKDCTAVGMPVVQKHPCISWELWRAARPWEGPSDGNRLRNDHHDAKVGTLNCKAWSKRLTGEWKPLTPPGVTLSGHRSRQEWWIKRERMKLLIFFREIRQIRLGYLIRSGMMDEEEFYFCLACGYKMRFWKVFLRMGWRILRVWFMWELNSSRVLVFLNAVTRNCRRRNFTWQYFECHGYTLQWNEVGVTKTRDNSEAGTGLREAGAGVGGNTV